MTRVWSFASLIGLLPVLEASQLRQKYGHANGPNLQASPVCME
jgi:hypothetical protein